MVSTTTIILVLCCHAATVESWTVGQLDRNLKETQRRIGILAKTPELLAKQDDSLSPQKLIAEQPQLKEATRLGNVGLKAILQPDQSDLLDDLFNPEDDIHGPTPILKDCLLVNQFALRSWDQGKAWCEEKGYTMARLPTNSEKKMKKEMEFLQEICEDKSFTSVHLDYQDKSNTVAPPPFDFGGEKLEWEDSDGGILKTSKGGDNWGTAFWGQPSEYYAPERCLFLWGWDEWKLHDGVCWGLYNSAVMCRFKETCKAHNGVTKKTFKTGERFVCDDSYIMDADKGPECGCEGWEGSVPSCKRAVYTGDGQPYDEPWWQGSCGFTEVANEVTTYYAAISDESFKGGDSCGRCIRIWCTDDRCNKVNDAWPSIVAQVVHKSPASELEEVEMSTNAFQILTGVTRGRYITEWEFIECGFSTTIMCPKDEEDAARCTVNFNDQTLSYKVGELYTCPSGWEADRDSPRCQCDGSWSSPLPVCSRVVVTWTSVSYTKFWWEGSCGLTQIQDEGRRYHVAINSASYTYENDEGNEANRCGQCVRVKCTDDRCDSSKWVNALIVDSTEGDMEMSDAVYEELTGQTSGDYDMSWELTECGFTGMACPKEETTCSVNLWGNEYAWSADQYFYCGDHWTATGNSMIHCQCDGSWSGSVPQCERPTIKGDGLPYLKDFTVDKTEFSCGFTELSPQAYYIVALTRKYYDNGGACGMCIRIECTDSRCPKVNNQNPHIYAQVVDMGPAGLDGELEMPVAAFEDLTNVDNGRYNVSWKFVDCNDENILVTTGGGSDKHMQLYLVINGNDVYFQPRNHRQQIMEMYIGSTKLDGPGTFQGGPDGVYFKGAKPSGSFDVKIVTIDDQEKTASGLTLWTTETTQDLTFNFDFN